MTVRKRALVSGRVQGVFFRDSCRRVAQDLGVGGSVTNRPDGSVEVVAEGDPAAVARLLDWCREGPPTAHVTSVEIQDEAPEGTEGFAIH